MMMKKEKVMVMVVVMVVVGAQVEAQYGYGPPAPADSGNRPPPKRHCASRCALRCLFRLRLQPVSYMLCFNLCMIKCKFLPSHSVYTCTSSCANSKTHQIDNTEEALQKVEGYVDSCYDNCSNKH